MSEFAVLFIQWLANILYLALIGRVILSWLNISPSNPLHIFVHQISDPLLSPIRRVLPKMGVFDFSPMVAIILITMIRNLIIAQI